MTHWFHMEHALAHRPIGDMRIRADPATDDVRRRITLAFAAMFIGLMAVATLEGFWPGGPGPAIAVVLLNACAVVAPFGMAVLSRPVLRDIDLITRENARLRELYGRAREDA